MGFADSLVVLGCLQFAVGRSNASLAGLQAVAVPLLFCWGDECVSKETVEIFIAGAAAIFDRQGRTIPVKSKWLSWEFDPTKGYAGQDILADTSISLAQPHYFRGVAPLISSFSLTVLFAVFICLLTSVFSCGSFAFWPWCCLRSSLLSDFSFCLKSPLLDGFSFLLTVLFAF